MKSYRKLQAYFGEETEEKWENLHDVFIGFFADGMHITGDRPKECAYMFSTRECTSLDCGKVDLPENRKSLDELVKGDLLTWHHEGNTTSKVKVEKVVEDRIVTGYVKR